MEDYDFYELITGGENTEALRSKLRGLEEELKLSLVDYYGDSASLSEYQEFVERVSEILKKYGEK